MNFSTKSEKWPLQSKPIYRFKWHEDGHISRTKINRYTLHPYPVVRFPLGSNIHVLDPTTQFDRVLNNNYTSWDNDIEKAYEAFRSHYLQKKTDAELQMLKNSKILTLLETYHNQKNEPESTKTLYEHIVNHPDIFEFTIYDADYDIEVYFYQPDPKNIDTWTDLLLSLTKLLTVKEAQESWATVNLSELIEKHIPDLKNANLFLDYDLDTIMDSMMNIISGGVSELWMKKFVDALNT